MSRLSTVAFAVSVACVAGLTLSHGGAQEPTEPPVDSRKSPTAGILTELDASKYENVFPIVDGDAKIGDTRISDVRLTGVISSITKLKLAKLMLLNKTGRSWKPDFKLRILNKYGVALGHGSVRWAIHALPKDERYEEEARLETFSHAEIFKYSSVQPVPDFDRPAFIAIEHAPK